MNIMENDYICKYVESFISSDNFPEIYRDEQSQKKSDRYICSVKLPISDNTKFKIFIGGLKVLKTSIFGSGGRFFLKGKGKRTLETMNHLPLKAAEKADLYFYD